MNGIVLAISTLVPMLRELFEYIQKLRERGRQSGELTAEQDAALDAEIKSITGQSWWKPDASKAPTQKP